MKQKSLLLFSALTICMISLGQKNLQKKEAMFKTPAYWKSVLDQQLKLAPKEAYNHIVEFNNSAKSKGYTFELAYTSVYGQPVGAVTGGKTPDMKDQKNQPKAEYYSLPPQPNLLNITSTANDSYVDMRDYGIVTKVDNQSSCGSCWAFAAVATFETAFLMKNGGDAETLDISEQQLLNCTGPANSCNGGFNTDASEYICSHRVIPELMYRYTARDSSCGMGNSLNSAYKGRRWGNVGSSVNDIKRAIIEHGSVASGIYFSGELHAYGGGVYNLNNQPNMLEVNHVIQIIGWDESKQAWLIKNSWGTGWGEGGFAWIRYGTNNIGLYSTWIEAEPFGTVMPVINNPHTSTTTGPNFNTADFNTLEALYCVPAIYRIISRQSNKVLDCDDPVGFAALSANKGRRMQQWDSHNRETLVSSDGHNQEWFFIQAGKRNEKPVYKIFNHGFTNFLTDNRSGNPVCENGNGSDNQLWYIMPQGSKTTVRIKNVATGKFVQVPAGNNSNGADIQMANEFNGVNQLFELSITLYKPDLGRVDSKFYLVPEHSTNSALDAPGGNVNDGTGMQIWQKINDNINQAWKISFSETTKYFRFHPALNESKFLEVLGISMDNNARVGLWGGWEGRNQEWLLIRIPRDREKFIIFNRNSGKCLDVTAVSTANGTAVQQWEYVNGNNQKWRLVRW